MWWRSEWLGGRYTLAHPVSEGDSVYRAEVILWLELPSGVLVGSELTHANKPATLAEVFAAATQNPAEGSPRRPSRIRVADEDTARELRGAAAGIPIVVGPVPELDDTFDDFLENLADWARRSRHLAGGDIPPPLVEELFKAASLLFRTAPWHRMSDQQIVRVDIPSLGMDGACLSVIGAAGESFGFMLFESVDDYHAFILPPAPAAANDRVTMRSLSFDRQEELPPSLLQEIEEHGWTVAGRNAYPVVLCVTAAREALAITEQDVRILTAVTRAFLAFFVRHRELFELDDPEPVREAIQGEDGLEITLTAPYTLFGDEGIRPTPPRRNVGRNDPCPCGSGRKYKKCHLDADRAPGH